MVYLNGRELQAPPGTSLAELLRMAGLDPETAVVLVDGAFVPRPEYARFAPREGARVRALLLPAGG